MPEWASESFHLPGRQLEFEDSFDFCRVPWDFTRTHRSSIVNLNAAYEFVPEPAGTAVLRLQGGTEVKVARRRADEVKAALT